MPGTESRFAEETERPQYLQVMDSAEYSRAKTLKPIDEKCVFPLGKNEAYFPRDENKENAQNRGK